MRLNALIELLLLLDNIRIGNRCDYADIVTRENLDPRFEGDHNLIIQFKQVRATGLTFIFY
jgi:hypothetical protein